MEYEFDWDAYILYLGTDMDNYVKKIPCKTLEEIEIELNKADLYEKYLVKGISFKRKEEFPIMQGRIEPNRIFNQDKTRSKKKGR